MSQPLQVARAVLIADAAVTALVDTRISPIIAAQNIARPFVTLQVLGVEPVNHLRGFGNLDDCRVIVTAWAETYDVAMQVATACRTALETAGHQCETRGTDQYNPDPNPGLYSVEHQFQLWL